MSALHLPHSLCRLGQCKFHATLALSLVLVFGLWLLQSSLGSSCEQTGEQCTTPSNQPASLPPFRTARYRQRQLQPSTENAASADGQLPRIHHAEPNCVPLNAANGMGAASLHRGSWTFNDSSQCFPADRFLNNSLCTKAYVLHAPHCPLRRFTSASAPACLSNRHLLFIGDSVTRYQFFNFIEHLGYFKGSRETSLRSDIYINRFYKRGYGHGPVGAAPGPFDTAKFLWYNSSMPEMARALKAGFGGVVDQLIVNSGLHGLPEFSGTVAEAHMQLQPLAMLLPDGRSPIWATTTLAIDDAALKGNRPRAEAELGPGYIAARDLGWRVLDRNGMVRSLARATASAGLGRGMGWFDHVHFKDFVNTEFNNVLLNMICPVLSSIA